jgi:hypothetical protein
MRSLFVMAASCTACSALNVDCGVKFVIENQFQNSKNGFFMLERDDHPRFTTESERIKNNAAVWTFKKESDADSCDDVILYGENIIIENQYSERGSLKQILARSKRRNPTFILDGNPDSDGTKKGWFQIRPATEWGNSDKMNTPVSFWKDLYLVNVDDRGDVLYLERNGKPGFTRDTGRDGKAAVWQLKPSGAGCPMTRAIQGSWIVVGTHTGEQKFEYSQGTEFSSGHSSTSEWSVETAATMTSGFEMGDVEVSSTYSETVSETMETYFSYTGTQKVTVSCPSGVLWQFQTQVEDACSGAKTFSSFTACTPNAATPPCCIPGYNKPGDTDYQNCLDGPPLLCTPKPSLSEGGKNMIV